MPHTVWPRKGYTALLALVLLISLLTPESISSRAPGNPLPESTPDGREPSRVGIYRDRWGEISIGQPKVWEFERVYAMLDGMLRDVEGISLASPDALDANETNATLIRFIQTMMSAEVELNRPDAIKSRLELEKLQTTEQGLIERQKASNTFLNSLYTLKADLGVQLVATKRKQLDATSEQEKTETGKKIKELEEAITDTDAKIKAAEGTSAAQPAASKNEAAKQEQVKSDLTPALTEIAKDRFKEAFKKEPSFPATMRMDNFITVLYERMARQLATLQDDVLRNPKYEAYMLQFDVGVYPSDRARGHVAHVEFEFSNCDGCRVYSLYPGQSSYNIASYYGDSNFFNFLITFKWLQGLGANGAYQRRKEELRSGLVQSVYISGFSGGKDFGWYYGAAPFEKLVSPGMRTTYAIVLVPRNEFGKDWPYLTNFEDSLRNEKTELNKLTGEFQKSPDKNAARARMEQQQQKVKWMEKVLEDAQRKEWTLRLKQRAHWYMRNRPGYRDGWWFTKGKEVKNQTDSRDSNMEAFSQPLELSLPTISEKAEYRPGEKLGVTKIEFNTKYSTNMPPTDESRKTAEVLITLDRPIDPNLLASVNGHPMKRVRDWRGRATGAIPPAQRKTADRNPLSAGRSLLEADDVEPNSWFPVNSKTLLLRISHEVAGHEDFPTIQIADPTGTVVLPHAIQHLTSEVVANGFKMDRNRVIHVEDNAMKENIATHCRKKSSPDFPGSTFLPIFLPEPKHALRFNAVYVDEACSLEITMIAEAKTDGSPEKLPPWLQTRAQVVLEHDPTGRAWSLQCNARGEKLFCDLPVAEIWNDANQNKFLDEKESGGYLYDFVVWIEQSDPEGNNSFYSAAPTSLPAFPLKIELAKNYKPWLFDHAEIEYVVMKGCSSEFSKDWSLTEKAIVGLRLWPLSRIQEELKASKISDEPNCKYVEIPTKDLTNPQIRFRIDAPQGAAKQWVTIPTERILPQFGKPDVALEPDPTGDLYQIKSWTIDFPAQRLISEDEITFACGDGTPCMTVAKLQNPSLKPTVVRIKFDRRALDVLPQEIKVFRKPANAEKIQVASIIGIADLVIPGKLSLVQTSKTEFALKGTNAEAINKVVVQAKSPVELELRRGSQFVIATFPSDPKLAPGTYPIVFKLAKNPIPAMDADGKPLNWIVPEPPEVNEKPSPTSIKEVRKDMTKEEVQKVLGAPKLSVSENNETVYYYDFATLRFRENKLINIEVKAVKGE